MTWGQLLALLCLAVAFCIADAKPRNLMAASLVVVAIVFMLEGRP